MKKLLLSALMAMASMAPLALSYEDARRQAWFLTDKMAYELNLTEVQYDHAYQINLDYFLSLSRPSDLYGRHWRYRDEDFRYILDEWQYRRYATIDYFFRPVRWVSARWYYPVFDRYRRGYYYFSRPTIYISYRGGFGHRKHHGISPYRNMRPDRGMGMRDGHKGGHYDHAKGWGSHRSSSTYSRPGGRDSGQGRHDGWNNHTQNSGKKQGWHGNTKRPDTNLNNNNRLDTNKQHHGSGNTDTRNRRNFSTNPGNAKQTASGTNARTSTRISQAETRTFDRPSGSSTRSEKSSNNSKTTNRGRAFGH